MKPELTFQHALLFLLTWTLGASSQTTTWTTWGTYKWEPQKFIGYYYDENQPPQPLLLTETEAVAWSTFSPYAGKCTVGKGDCAIPTSCDVESRTLYFSDSSYVCPSTMVCAPMTVYASARGATPNPSVLNYECRRNWKAWAVYNQLPSSITFSSVVSSSTLSPSPTGYSATASSTSVPPTPPPTFTSTSTSTSLPDPKPHRKTKIWIAGAVLGPIIGLALLAFACIWWQRRKRARERDIATTRRHQLPGFGNQEYTLIEQHGQHAELENSLIQDSALRHAELPGSHTSAIELPDTRKRLEHELGA